MNAVDGLLDELVALETELHHPGRPCTRERLGQLLHPDFHEIGRSGRPYDRATVLAWLSRPPVPQDVVSDAFCLECLAPGIALLHFRSMLRGPGGQRLLQHTLRMSLWLHSDAGWQLRYHQGTPAAEAW